MGCTLLSVLLLLVERVCAHEREAQVGEPLEQPLQVRLVADRADERGRACVPRQRHAVEGLGGAIAELTFDDEPVDAASHETNRRTTRAAAARNAPGSHW